MLQNLETEVIDHPVLFLDETCLRFVGRIGRPRLSFVLPVPVMSFPMHWSPNVLDPFRICAACIPLRIAIPISFLIH